MFEIYPRASQAGQLQHPINDNILTTVTTIFIVDKGTDLAKPMSIG